MLHDQVTRYDEVCYVSSIVAPAAPEHLHLCGQWHALHTVSPCRFHFTELGCGDAANLLALAFYHSRCTFLGIDNSVAQLELALAGAARIGVTNLSFLHCDIRELNPDTLASSDYIVAHGLYSWVPEDAREAILRFCRRNLKPTGLAYISYNAQPGWAVRGLVRETLLRSPPVRDAPIQEKAARAIELAASLLEDMPSREYASAVLLADELERVRNGAPFYVLHEYLAEVNDGFWLGDFVRAARRHGLEYVCDAQFCRWEGRVSPELRARVARRSADQVEQEEMADLLGDRYFHASVLCRADAERTPVSRDELWEQVHIATSLGALSDQFDLAEGVVERFTGTNGVEITLSAAITKAAIVSLCPQWPRGSTLHDIRNRSKSLLAQYGFPVQDDCDSHLRADLTTLFEAGQIDLRLREPRFTSEVPTHPEAHALARFEATQRTALSTPFHLPIPFDPAAMELVRQLDGRRSTAELVRDFGDSSMQTVEILARWGLLV